jgi:hypothetical protein
VKGIFRLCDYEVGERLYHYKEKQWVFHGVIENKEENLLYVRLEEFDGIHVIREDVLVKEGFISKVGK